MQATLNNPVSHLTALSGIQGSSVVSTMPSNLAAQSVYTCPTLWMLFVAQLNPMEFEFTPNRLSELFNIQAAALRYHCRQLWPERYAEDGNYILSFEEACTLIYRITSGRGYKLPKAKDLHLKLLERGVIDNRFPQGSALIDRAGKAILDDREKRKKARCRMPLRSH